jgi:hypothetical protein
MSADRFRHRAIPRESGVSIGVFSRGKDKKIFL